jgi:hypothetical protein
MDERDYKAMNQEIKMTHKEKVSMYKKIKKAKLIEMLIGSHDLLRLYSEKENTFSITPSPPFVMHQCHHNFIQKDSYWKSCTHCGTIQPLSNNGGV